jgi:hypothetical protein
MMERVELEKLKAQTAEEEPSPPPLGVNVVETITSKEKLGGD